MFSAEVFEVQRFVFDLFSFDSFTFICGYTLPRQKFYKRAKDKSTAETSTQWRDDNQHLRIEITPKATVGGGETGLNNASTSERTQMMNGAWLMPKLGFLPSPTCRWLPVLPLPMAFHGIGSGEGTVAIRASKMFLATTSHSLVSVPTSIGGTAEGLSAALGAFYAVGCSG
jgi:hypothetical protein